MSLRVSIQQAALNSLAKFLNIYFSDCNVYTRWPESQVQLDKAITIIQAGPREIDYVDPQVLRKLQDTDSTHGVWSWRLGYCSLPIQLDVWTTSDFERDDLLARLDDVLHFGDRAAGFYDANPVGAEILVKLDPADGWEGTAAICFQSPDLIETPDQVQQMEYRATYRGDVYFELTVNAPSARIAQIKLYQMLFERDVDVPGVGRDTTIVDSNS